jgi:hypothetical protein
MDDQSPRRRNFIDSIPVIVQAVSNRLLRALGAFMRHIGNAVRRMIVAATDRLIELAKYSWRLYCRIEFSIVDAVLTVLLTLWAARYLLLLLLGGIVLVYFRYWAFAAGYVFVVALAIWRFYRTTSEDLDNVELQQAPVRGHLVRMIRWGLRLVALIASVAGVGYFHGIEPSSWYRSLIDTPTTRSESVRTEASSPPASQPNGEATSSDAIPPPPSKHRTGLDIGPKGAQTSKWIGDLDVESVCLSNVESIRQTAQLALAGSATDVRQAATLASRTSDFDSILSGIARDRLGARPLNAAALSQFATTGPDAFPASYSEIIQLQRRAFSLDPGDVEIAGNLAIYLLQSHETHMALCYAVYAISLPRGDGSTGRTADWSTIAAAFAALGDEDNAVGALLVTLALSSDVNKRCQVAIYATRHAYGRVLRPATEALLKRAQELQGVGSGACNSPNSW